MITIFTIPKSFKGLDEIHQLNAIQSWILLRPKCEIILCGDDPTVIEAAQELKLRSLTGLQRTKYGTPLLDSVFSKVYEIAKYPIFCYVNSDIIFVNEFIESIARIKMKKYLAIGQRTNVEMNHLIDYFSLDWKMDLLKYVNETGKLYGPGGIDYFVFTKNSDYIICHHLLLVAQGGTIGLFIMHEIKMSQLLM